MASLWAQRGMACQFVSLIACVVMVGLSAAHAEGAEVSHELGKIKPKQLTETSGIAASRQNPEVLWLHNDGDGGLVFGVSTSGKLVALLSTPVAVDDFEDIAIGPGPDGDTDYLYIGDIGDNDERRREIRVVRFAEPRLADKRGVQLNVEGAEEFRLAYPDGPHNAEAMFVDPMTGELYVVTKEKGRARLYSVPADRLRDRALATLEAAGRLAADEVSGGAISRDGRRIVLRREARGWLWNREEGESVAAAMQRAPQKIPVLGKRQGPNGESISFSPAGDSYYTISEGKKESVYRFDLPTSPPTPGR